MRLRLFSLMLGALLAPRPAQAWTDAHVREAQAVLQLDLAQQKVAVALDLSVEVRGGWLERLELTGLDDGLVPEPEDAAYALLDGEEQVPGKLSLRGPVASVSFQRRDGLRRGMHRVVLRYSVPLAQLEVREAGASRVTWTMPGWESGLTRGSIEFRGAGLLRPVVDAESAQEVEQRDDQGAPVLRFARVHVPRASPWTVAVEVARSLQGGAQGESSAPPKLEIAAGSRWRTGAALGLALFLLTLLRRVLRGPAGGRTWLGAREACALAVLGAACWSHLVPAALACWTVMSWGALWPRGACERPLPLGRVVPLHADAMRGLRRRALRDWIGVPGGELVSLCGALELAALVALVVSSEPAFAPADPWGLGVLCAPFGALAGSRWWRGRDSAQQVAVLVRAAQRSRMLACGLSLCAYVADGRAYYPRLRLWPGVRYPGLTRVEVLVHARRDTQPLWLSIEVEPGSPAARWLTELWPDLKPVQRDRTRRLCLRRPINDVGVAADKLLEHLGRETQRCLTERAPARAA